MTNKYENTISDELIAFIFSGKSNGRRKAILYEMAKNRFEMKKSVYNQNIYRLKKNGYLIQENDNIIISPKGILYQNNQYRYIKNKIEKKNKIIFIFDIPETKKKAREWVRNQIKFWDFTMIQKSVWVGHGPLPLEFSNRLKVLEIDKCVRTFNVQSKNR